MLVLKGLGCVQWTFSDEIEPVLSLKISNEYNIVLIE